MSSTSTANTTNPRDDPDTDLQCEICRKTYGRKDLRDRHRRRCIKNAGQKRPSKRKSCDSCAHKKLRCSMARPACCRCLQMGTPCHYPSSALCTKHAVTAVSQKSQEFSSSISFSSKALAPGPIPVPLAPRAGDLSPVSGLDLVPEGEAATATPHQTHQTPNVASFDPPSSFTSIEFIAHPFPESPFPLLSVLTIRPVIWNEDFTLLYDHFSAGGFGPRMLLDNPSSGTFTPIPDVPKTALGDMDNFSPVSVTGNSWSTFSQSPPYDESRRPSTDDTVSYPSTPIQNGNSNGSSPLVFGYSFAHKSGSLISQDVTDLYQEMFQIMREFPSLLLEGQFWSPFVHRTIYDCSLGRMAEPMGIPLEYIRGHASSIGSSHDFAHQMINQERGRLVRDFNTYVSDTPEMCLDALHAVCVYQILGLFGDTLPTAPGPHSPHEAGERGCEECARAAQLHISFLLKMTRRLYEIYEAPLNVHHENENDWTWWKFMESLRRNIFLVNIINILGAKACKLNEDYFEPLGDNMVLNLPLPAPEYMWRACSEEEWKPTREHTLQPSLSHSLHVPKTLRELLDLDKSGELDVPSLLPLTRMILACVKIRPPGNDL